MENMPLDESVKKWMNLFINQIKGLNYSKNTIFTYNQQLLVFFDYCVENTTHFSLKTIKPMHITNFFTYIDDINIKNKGKALSSSTKSAYLRTLKSFFKFITKNNDELYDFDYLFENFKLKTTSNKKEKINYLNDKEQTKIVNLFEKRLKKNKIYINYRNLFLLKLLMQGGLRISEALNLKLSDFELNRDNFYEISILSKGGDYDTIFMLEDLIKDEMDYFYNIFKQDDYIFISNNGEKMSRILAYKIFETAYNKCGIKKSGCHILRHTFAMNLLFKDAKINVIQKALRHKRIQTTLIYADTTSDMIKEELVKVQSLN